jgi:hypothetical protein
MPTFDITAPDGKTYEIEGANAEGALAALQKHLGGAPPQRSVMDKLTGADGGERVQTWPERAVRGIASSVKSAATLPGDVMAGEASPNDTGRVLDMAMMGTPVNPAIRAGDAIVPGVSKSMRAEKAAVPTTEELAKAGGADIQAAKASGLDVAAPSVADYSRKVQQELFDNGGISPIDAPATFAKLKALEDAPPDAIFTAANLQSFRESLQATAQNFNPAAAKDQLAASRAIKGFDQLIPVLDEASVLAGAPAATQKLFERGRGNYAAGQRSNDLTGKLDRATTGIVERSEGRAQAVNSGRNLDNNIRTRVESFLEKPKEVSGFSDAELLALEGVRDGGVGRNAARYVSNLLGGGGGAAQSIFAGTGAGVGMLAGGIPGALMGGAAPAVVGAGAKSIANALAKRSINKADELIRKRSPMYEERLANPNMSVATPEGRAALIRALMAAESDR